MRILRVGFAALAAACSSAAPMQQPLMNWDDLLGQPMPTASAHIAYGEDPRQFVEVWRPEGHGPFPVVLMIHGGCWRSRIANLTIMNYIAEDLRTHGVAVWNLEYRGAGDVGGGYPGTFEDVARGADLLRTQASAYNFRTDRIVAFGHSAGGHLGLWLAARSRLPQTSALHSVDPLHIDAVISSGGLPDLEADRAAEGDAACGARVIDDLVGAPTDAHPDVYADTSPARLLPFAARQLIVNADQDGVAPPWLGEAYLHKAQTTGAHAEMIVIPQSGHVELIAPNTRAWTRERALIQSLLR